MFGVLIMSIKKITLKERQRVARTMAAKAGADSLTPEIIQTVGNMSDDEIRKYINDCIEQTAAAVEVLAPDLVDEIKPGSGADYSKIYPLLVDVANNYIMSNNWDAEKITPLQWGSICLTVGNFARARSWFRGSDVVSHSFGNNNKCIDFNAVAGAVPVWLDLCYKYNKPPLICDFCYFCGFTSDVLRAGVTPESVALRKTLNDIQADGLRARALSPKESPIGAIFLLKADHGLIEATKTIHETAETTARPDALPDFAAFSDENGQK